MLKHEVVGLGFAEIITFGLTQIAEQTDYLFRTAEGLCIVDNAHSIDCQCPRNSLVAGLLKTFKNNKSASLPLNLFELGDIVLLEGNLARN